MTSDADESDFGGEVYSEGGPLVLIPERFVSEWLGIEPPTDGRVVYTQSRWSESSPPCDYDRACDVDDFLGELTVGDGSALVLGDEPLPTAWRPCPNAEGGVLARCRYVDSPHTWQQLLHNVPILEFDLTGYRFDNPGVRVALFDSALPGSRFPSNGQGTWLPIPPGVYRIGLYEWQPTPGAAFLLHHLKRT